MPTTPPVNIQQVLQMGTYTEKVQQTIQSLQSVTAQQLNKEREVLDELKRSQVQELKHTYFIEKVDARAGSKKRARVLKKKSVEEELAKSEPDENIPPEIQPGSRINIKA